MKSAHHDSRRALQLERVILFSDAVFAIAITLLIIEIKVPSMHDGITNETDLLWAVARLAPKFLGFLISFLLVGMYWTRHHVLFGYVIDYTSKLLWLNLLFLLSIVLMPFSTGIFGEYSTPKTIHYITPLAVYVLNFCYSGFTLFLLWRYVGNPANRVSDDSLTPEITRAAKTRAVVISSVFALTIPVAFINPWAARYVPILIPFVLRLVNRGKRKEKR
ncbi:MAG: TMEM175 family protein [Ignavibacteriales bacterium]|nr:TMEM175 family protein [Ignavibacteriales bacterium]